MTTHSCAIRLIMDETMTKAVYGYLPPAYAAPGTELEIIYFGARIAATVSAEPLYDPKMEQLRA